MIRRWRNLLARRGQFQPLPPPTSSVPLFRAATDRRNLPGRRGNFQPLVPAPVAPAAPTWPQFRPTMDRRGLPSRRGVFQPLSPAPTSVPVFRATTDRRGLLIRRGAFLPLVPPPVVAAVAWSPPFRAVRARLTGVAQRGSFAWVPPTTAAAPIFGSRRTRPAGAVQRTGRFFPLPQPSVTAPASAMARRSRVVALPSHRGVFQPVMPPQTVAGPGPLVLATVRGATRRTLPPARRGAFARVPLVGVLPGTAPLPPQLHGRAARFALPTRHGKFLPFTPAPVVASAGPLVTRLLRLRTQLVGPARHGKFLPLVPVAAAVPPIARPSRAAALPARHGKFLPIIPAPVVVAPQPLVARVTRLRTPLVGPSRSGTFIPLIPDTPGPRVLVRPTRSPRPGLARRGRIFTVPPLKPAGPGPLPPAMQRRARARHLPLVRGRFQQQHLLGLVVATYTPPIHAGTPADAATRVHGGTPTDAATRYRGGTPT